MPRLIIAPGALSDIDRCRAFLKTKSTAAAQRAVTAIRRGLTLLIDVPEAGRPSRELPEFRELIIEFGDSGYIARYLHDVEHDAVRIVALWHQRETGY